MKVRSKLKVAEAIEFGRVKKGPGPFAGARSCGVSERAAGGGGPEHAEYRIVVLDRGTVTRDRA